jgi:hypothetical protein
MEILAAIKFGMWIIASSVAIVTGGLGFVFGYHWITYSGNKTTAIISILVYASISLVLLLWMIGSIPI